jgi:hypothetical protein
MDYGLISQKGRGLTIKWWGIFLVQIYFSMENRGGLSPPSVDR